jgi:hypothetical protein
MRQLTLTLALALSPMLAAAQASAGAQGEARARADVSLQRRDETRIPEGFSVETRARLEAMVEAAKKKNLPTEPMTDVMAEGQAKGASEAQIVAASATTMGQLEASLQALIQGGRERPSDAEVQRGAAAIARGATSVQLEALVRRAPSERRLEVAFEVLTELAARGVPVDRALLAVGGNLSAGATDGQLVSILASGNGQAGLRLGTARRP